MITERLCKLPSDINRKYGNFVWLSHILITQKSLALCSDLFKEKLQYLEEKVCLQLINQIKYLDISNLSL